PAPTLQGPRVRVFFWISSVSDMACPFLHEHFSILKQIALKPQLTTYALRKYTKQYHKGQGSLQQRLPFLVEDSSMRSLY
ncbi:MAG: hypothetical protein ACRDHZ_24110, partial [Ktedonobacteraceae bacterium]